MKHREEKTGSEGSGCPLAADLPPLNTQRQRLVEAAKADPAKCCSQEESTQIQVHKQIETERIERESPQIEAKEE